MSKAVAIVHRKFIQAKLRQGYLLKTIASQLQVSSAAISQVLAQACHYKLARRVGAELRLQGLNLVHVRGEPLKWQIRRYLSDFGPIPDHIMRQIVIHNPPADDKPE